jgi:3-oxoacyl-[acyl-carrier-protein] synthase II
VKTVVTGTGVASPVLRRPDDILASGPTADAGFDPATFLGRGYRYNDRATKLALLAVARALADARLVTDGPDGGALTVPGESCGLVASSNLGNLDTVCRVAQVIADKSISGTSPMDLQNASSNIVASAIAVRFGLRGPNVMLCNGATSGLDAVYLGASLVSAGRVSRVVVVGVEPANAVVERLTGRPAQERFDGAVAAVLESADAAAARGVASRAALGGYGRRADVRTSVSQALADHSPPGLWLVDGDTPSPTIVSGVARHDIQAELGDASGALGVLQLAAAVRMADTGIGSVLATAGAAEESTASLLVINPGRAV